MNRQRLIRQIKAKAKQDQKNRRDPRFVETVGFLVAKGFLQSNFEVPLLPNKKIHVKDAIWAGKNVEPRILEVLPAAVLRLEKHFYPDPDLSSDLTRVVEQLRRRDIQGDSFYGIPYAKIRQWADFPLSDRRVKAVADKKVVKTFRLRPEVVDRLRELARVKGLTETDVLEELIKAR